MTEASRAADDASINLSEADHFYGTARGLLLACRALVTQDDSSGHTRFMGPLHFMMGFAVELYMKAALAQTGISAKELRRKYNHNLLPILYDAERAGVLNFH